MIQSVEEKHKAHKGEVFKEALVGPGSWFWSLGPAPEKVLIR